MNAKNQNESEKTTAPTNSETSAVRTRKRKSFFSVSGQNAYGPLILAMSFGFFTAYSLFTSNEAIDWLSQSSSANRSKDDSGERKTDRKRQNSKSERIKNSSNNAWVPPKILDHGVRLICTLMALMACTFSVSLSSLTKAGVLAIPLTLFYLALFCLSIAEMISSVSGLAIPIPELNLETFQILVLAMVGGWVIAFYLYLFHLLMLTTYARAKALLPVAIGLLFLPFLIIAVTWYYSGQITEAIQVSEKQSLQQTMTMIVYCVSGLFIVAFFGLAMALVRPLAQKIIADSR